MRKFSAGLRAALIVGLSITLAACKNDLALFSEVSPVFYETEESEVQKHLDNITSEQQAFLLQLAYGDAVVNISPESGRALFSNIESFVTGVVAPLLAANPALREFLKKDDRREIIQLRRVGEGFSVSFLRQLNEDEAGWVFLGAMTRTSVELLGGSKIRDRVRAIRQRVGDDVFSAMAPARVRDLVWNEGDFNRFLIDRDFAERIATQAVADQLFYTGYKDQNKHIEQNTRHIMRAFEAGWPPSTSSRTGT